MAIVRISCLLQCLGSYKRYGNWYYKIISDVVDFFTAMLICELEGGQMPILLTEADENELLQVLEDAGIIVVSFLVD